MLIEQENAGHCVNSPGRQPLRRSDHMHYFSKPQPAQPAIERTRWAYKNDDGHRLYISTVGHEHDHVELSITGVGDLDWRSLNIPAGEAPGIALAILKVAGFRAANPRTSDKDFFGGDEAGAEWAVMWLEKLAAAQQVQNHEKDLTRRRDELACNLAGDGAFAYRFALPDHQRAINMIIQLQDEVSK